MKDLLEKKRILNKVLGNRDMLDYEEDVLGYIDESDWDTYIPEIPSEVKLWH